MEESSSSSTNQSSRKTRSMVKKQAVESSKESEGKRRKTGFLRRRNNIIGPNDIIVDKRVNKIKVEPRVGDADEVKPDPPPPVVQSVEGLEMDEQIVGNEDEQVDVIVKQEVDIPNEEKKVESFVEELINVREKCEEGEPNPSTSKNGRQNSKKKKGTAVVSRRRELRSGGRCSKDRKLKKRLEMMDMDSEPELKIVSVTGTTVSVEQTFRVEMVEGDLTFQDLESQAGKAKGIEQKDTDFPMEQWPVETGSDSQSNGNAIAELTTEHQECEVTQLILDNEQQEEDYLRDDSGIYDDLDVTVLDGKVFELFEEVVKILFQQGKLHASLGFVDWGYTWSILKKCRLICKAWKETIDTVIEQDPSHVALCSVENSLISWKTIGIPCPCNFGSRNINKMEFFSSFKDQQAQDPSYNPLPSRHLMISKWYMSKTTYAVEWNPFLEAVLEYLKTFGEQVWYFTAQIRHNFSLDYLEDKALHRCVSRWLQFTPNLKSLTISISYKEFGACGDESETDSPLVQMSESVTFPHLKELITLQCGWDSLCVPNVLKSNNHISRLLLDGIVGTSKILEMGLPHLSQLSFCIKKKEHLVTLESVAWKLEKLTLSFNKLPKQPRLINIICRVVEKFRETLEYLSLDLSGIEGFEDHTLDLPRLKNLHVTHQEWRYVYWGSFLEKLSGLETVTLKLQEHCYDDLESPGCHPSLTLKEIVWGYIKYIPKESYWFNLTELKNVNLTVQYKRGNLRKKKQHFLKRPGLPAVRFDFLKVGYLT